MSTTLDRLEEVDQDMARPHVAPGAGPTVPLPRRYQRAAEPRPERRRLRLSPWQLGAAWLVIASSLVAFEPAPQDPNAPLPLWAGLLATAFLGSLAAAMAGLIGRRSWAPAAFLAAGVSGLVIAAGCLSTAHHSMPYPLLEMVGFGTLTWLSWRTMTSGPTGGEGP
jgi:hypothetical protein